MTDQEIRKILAQEWSKNGWTPSACQDVIDGNQSGIVLGAISAVRRAVDITKAEEP